MSKRVDISRYTLPLEIDPPTRVCFRVEVPNDIYHIGAFLGQIWALSWQQSWERDAAHTARLAAKVWLDIFNNLRPGCDCPSLPVGIDGGDEPLIRQNPDNPCLLETSINGTDWCVWADLSKCVPAGGQPGAGSGAPPAGGGSACYEARMQGSGKWLLPTQVNTGDVITISEIKGAATDGSGIWYCPNGQTFFLNACAGAITTSGGDPLNTVGHMRLIFKIDAAYHDGYNTTLTVPGGISNANVEFQMNDSSLSDNFGEITFKVCVQNNAAAVWSHTFDFIAGDGGFVSDAAHGGAAYIPGTGWVSNNSGANAFSIHRTGLAAFTLTEAQWTIIADSPTGGANLYTDGDVTPTFSAVGYSGTGSQLKIFSGSIVITSGSLRLGMDGTNDSGGHHQKITKIVLSGTGADPFA